MKLTLEYSDENLIRLYLACEGYEDWRKAREFADKIVHANDEVVEVDVEF